MKIDTNNIPPEGLFLDEEISSRALELDTEMIKFISPVRVRAKVYRITNAVNVKLSLDALMRFGCSRCLEEATANYKKEIELSYQANKQEPLIDLDSDIREEIILDYPIKPLCQPDCKGLCPKCGKRLNEGGCSCGTT
jgi:uncharacterized protein